VSSANILVGVNSVIPEWFAIFNGESISQLEARGIDTKRYNKHLEKLIKRGKLAVYFNNIAGFRIPRTLEKEDLICLLDSMFHEYIHLISEQVWQETDSRLHWSRPVWAKEAITQRMTSEHLPHLYSNKFLQSAGLNAEDFRRYTQRRVKSDKPDSLANLLFIYLVDAIANEEYVYGNGKDLFLDSIKDPNFNPIKSRFNTRVGVLKDSYEKYDDAFKYFVNAPIPEVALYFFIEEKERKKFNGRTLAQLVKEAYDIGYSAENVKLLKGGKELKAEYYTRWAHEFE
ncbi:MAG: hypothetical protein KKA61_02010, partial [Nanoarchaeota archaeon]|nr:hypothetical protein [Nanoarchaeota archaeon]